MELTKNHIREKSVSTLLIEAKEGLDNAHYFLDKKRPEPAKANLEKVSQTLNQIIYSDANLTPKETATIYEYSKLNIGYSLRVLRLMNEFNLQIVPQNLTPGQAKRNMHKQFELNQSNYVEKN